MRSRIGRRKSYTGIVALAEGPVLERPVVSIRAQSAPAAFVRSSVALPQQLPAPDPNMLAASVLPAPYSLQQSVAEARAFQSRGRDRARRLREQSERETFEIEDWVHRVTQTGAADQPSAPREVRLDSGSDVGMGSSSRIGSSSRTAKPMDMKMGINPPEIVTKDWPLPYGIIVRIRTPGIDLTPDQVGGLFITVYLTNEDKVDLPAGILTGVCQTTCRLLPSDCSKSIKDGTQAVAVFQNLKISTIGEYRFKLSLYRDCAVVDQLVTRRFRVVEPSPECGAASPCESLSVGDEQRRTRRPTDCTPASGEKQLRTHLLDWNVIRHGEDGLLQAN